MDLISRLDITEKILSVLVALLTLSGAGYALIKKLKHNLTPDLQKVMYRSLCLPLGDSAGRIFHVQWPYTLPVCFKSPMRSEYNYIVIGDVTDDQREQITSEPRLANQFISSSQVGNTRWYRLSSTMKLNSIRFNDHSEIDGIAVVNAELYPLGTWNNTPPITVPRGRTRAYALAITEQIGSSTWYVSINNHEFTFNQNLGCHLVELYLSPNKQHTLSLGYKEGSKGIACAFFAF
jgi:hypothetical protein